MNRFIQRRKPERVVARSAKTGLAYVGVDWETKDTGWVYVETVNGSRYLVRVANVVTDNGENQ